MTTTAAAAVVMVVVVVVVMVVMVGVVAIIGTLRYPGRGLGGRRPEGNSQGLESNLHACHATWQPPPQSWQ